MEETAHNITFQVVDRDAWMPEIDLRPEQPWLRMGARRLGDEGWILVDSDIEEQVRMKAELYRERQHEVFAVSNDSEDVCRWVAALIHSGWMSRLATRPTISLPAASPFARAAMSVQEDLCLLRHRDGLADDGWYLDAASVSFPSRWALADKFQQRMDHVHAPVPGYAGAFDGRVTSLMNALGGDGERRVVRRNWFIHPNPVLFQPQRPERGDPFIPSFRCLDDLYLRSERQVLGQVAETGWLLFTIRTQQASLREFVEDGGRRDDVIHYMREADIDVAQHRGISPAQATAIIQALE